MKDFIRVALASRSYNEMMPLIDSARTLFD
jgi:hypothetical protein